MKILLHYVICYHNLFSWLYAKPIKKNASYFDNLPTDSRNIIHSVTIMTNPTTRHFPGMKYRNSIHTQIHIWIFIAVKLEVSLSATKKYQKKPTFIWGSVCLDFRNFFQNISKKKWSVSIFSYKYTENLFLFPSQNREQKLLLNSQINLCLNLLSSYL